MGPLRLFKTIFPAEFLRRPNRFLVECAMGGRKVTAFLPNPGRLLELLLPGSVLYLVRETGNETRKTGFTAVAVERDRLPVMLHTHRTNDVARYLLEHGRIPGLEQAEIVKPEARAGRSRLDFLLRDPGGEIFLEVKSCTLFGEKVAMFPDAITARGARHLLELQTLAQGGMRTAVLFVVHWPNVRFFMPDYHTDLAFAETLLAVREHVRVIPVAVAWGPDLVLSQKSQVLEIPWTYIQGEAKDRGSYLLILRIGEDMSLTVGGLGNVLFRKGFYIYIGSAMAHLTKRIERHRREGKQLHWHIDYLREKAEFRAALPVRSSARLECDLARAVQRIADWSIPLFGSSDCACTTHLLGMGDDPLCRAEFHKMLQFYRMDRYSSDEEPSCG
jgi:sugar fermentation stimulation protein A